MRLAWTTFTNFNRPHWSCVVLVDDKCYTIAVRGPEALRGALGMFDVVTVVRMNLKAIRAYLMAGGEVLVTVQPREILNLHLKRYAMGPNKRSLVDLPP